MLDCVTVPEPIPEWFLERHLWSLAASGFCVRVVVVSARPGKLGET
jgi:hypothetical protein